MLNRYNGIIRLCFICLKVFSYPKDDCINRMSTSMKKVYTQFFWSMATLYIMSAFTISRDVVGDIDENGELCNGTWVVSQDSTLSLNCYKAMKDAGCDLMFDSNQGTEIGFIPNGVNNTVLNVVPQSSSDFCTQGYQATFGKIELQDYPYSVVKKVWVTDPPAVSLLIDSISFKIDENSKHIILTFYENFPGVLMKLYVKCLNNVDEDLLNANRNCVMIKYGGTLTLPLSAAVFTKEMLTTSSRTQVVLSSTQKHLTTQLTTLPTQTSAVRTSVVDAISSSLLVMSSFHLGNSSSKGLYSFLSIVEENVLQTSNVASFSVRLTEPDGASARLSGDDNYLLAIIIASVFGAVAFLLIIILLILLCLRCRKKSEPLKEPEYADCANPFGIQDISNKPKPPSHSEIMKPKIITSKLDKPITLNKKKLDRYTILIGPEGIKNTIHTPANDTPSNDVNSQNFDTTFSNSQNFDTTFSNSQNFDTTFSNSQNFDTTFSNSSSFSEEFI